MMMMVESAINLLTKLEFEPMICSFLKNGTINRSVTCNSDVKMGKSSMLVEQKPP